MKITVDRRSFLQGLAAIGIAGPTLAKHTSFNLFDGLAERASGGKLSCAILDASNNVLGRMASVSAAQAGNAMTFTFCDGIVTRSGVAYFVQIAIDDTEVLRTHLVSESNLVRGNTMSLTDLDLRVSAS